jgi:hypothetical protein
MINKPESGKNQKYPPAQSNPIKRRDRRLITIALGLISRIDATANNTKNRTRAVPLVQKKKSITEIIGLFSIPVQLRELIVGRQVDTNEKPLQK